MDPQHIETLIIGAGQAGLATAYHLRRRGRPVLIVDANPRVGHNWRMQRDTLRLYTPAKYALRGLPFPATRSPFPQKDEVGEYLERYALHFDLPVRTSTHVDHLEARPDGGYVATVGDERISCDNVVVAIGTGFKQVFDWIGLPVLDEHDWPVEYRGVVHAAPGLYFCGLSFQYALSSMVFPGISRDADYVARQIVARSATPRLTAV
jgi:glycine/D-amino acid oxidase-like deaminating enzyme